MKSWLREWQDNKLNEGWRIQRIPHETDLSKGLRPDNNWVALLFAIAFVTSLVVVVKTRGNDPTIGMIGAAISFLGMFISALVHTRLKKSKWVKIQSKCIDKELNTISVSGMPGRVLWTWRWLCEFELNGKKYRVTPDYFSSYSPTAGKLGAYNNKQIAEELGQTVFSNENTIELWVNPNNPLETEIAKKMEAKDFEKVLRIGSFRPIKVFTLISYLLFAVFAYLLSMSCYSLTWNQSEARILSTQISSHLGSGRIKWAPGITYRPEIIYEFEVNGKKYVSNSVFFGSTKYSGPLNQSQKVISMFPQNSFVTV